MKSSNIVFIYFVTSNINFFLLLILWKPFTQKYQVNKWTKRAQVPVLMLHEFFFHNECVKAKTDRINGWGQFGQQKKRMRKKCDMK